MKLPFCMDPIELYAIAARSQLCHDKATAYEALLRLRWDLGLIAFPPFDVIVAWNEREASL